MNSLEHLQRVLPSTGLYVTTIINSHDKDEKPQQRFYSTVDALAKSIAKEEYPGWEIYYGISSFKKKGRRKQDNVHATRVLVLDVDCGVSASGKAKPYPTWREGLIALRDFVSVTGLPDPMVVGSGNGLHAYWILDEDLPPEQWQPLAEALKLATVQHGFKVDPGLTANSALILRPVGTMNYKHDPPSKVRLLIDRGPYPVAALAAVLPMTPAGPVSLVNGKHFGQSKLAAAIMGGNESTTVAEVVATKCQQIKWCIAHPNEVDEPLWYDLLGVAAYCTEPDATAIEWSKGHPAFNQAGTLKKMKQWQDRANPTTCKKFEDDRPSGCKDCKFRGKITSPAQLGVHHQEITAVPSDIPILVAVDIPFPKAFKRTTDGIKKTIDGVDLDVFPFPVYAVSYGSSDTSKYEDARFCINRPQIGWQDLILKNAHLMPGNERDFATALGHQGIRLASKFQIEWSQEMMRKYMDTLCKMRGITNLQSTLGWRDNDLKFAIGNNLYKRNDDATVEEQIIAQVMDTGNEMYSVKGSLKKMVDFTALLDKLDMQAHMFALCVSLSAPLYKFTGLKGQTLSLFGDTGSGKTLAQLWAQSIWGNPELLHLTAKHTANALYKRMGTVCNLPVTVDEFTTQDSSEIGDFLFSVTQGRDKLRLNRDSEEKHSLFFAMPVIVSTNMSLNDRLQATSGYADAQLMRLLEVNVMPNAYIVAHPDIGDNIRKLISNNFGHVGREFIKRLVSRGPDAIAKAIDAAQAEFDAVYGVTFNGKERYWRNMLVLAHLAGKWAAEWGLIKFDYQRGIIWTLEQLGSLRRSVTVSKRDAFDLVGDYLNKHSDTAVYEDVTGSHALVRPANTNARGPIRIRYKRWRDKPVGPFLGGVVFIDAKDFREFVDREKHSFTTIMKTLGTLITTSDKKDPKICLGKGTPTPTTQIRVIGIALEHERLQGILDPTVSDDDAPVDRRLRLV